MPQLRDPNFRRSVMLLVHHDESGTFGLVLNRALDLSAQSLCETLELRWGGNLDDSIHWGGPVAANTGWVLFRPDRVREEQPEGVTKVMDDSYFAGSLEVLREVAADPPSQLKLYLGYAGWGPGQLEEEMTDGAWLVAPATNEIVFGVDCDDMWDHVVRGLGIDPATLISAQGLQ